MISQIGLALLEGLISPEFQKSYHIFTHQDSHLQTQYYPNLVLSLPLVGTLTAKGPLLLKLCNCYYISHITFLFFCFFLHHLRTFFGELMSFCKLNIRISPSGEGKTKKKLEGIPGPSSLTNLMNGHVFCLHQTFQRVHR